MGAEAAALGHGGDDRERCPQETSLPNVGLFLFSSKQMHGKTASLKSPESCTEQLDRVQAPLDSR